MEKIFTLGNTAINYLHKGQGQPVVLLHGFGEDRNIWNYQIDFLLPHCHLLVPDLPGSGKSGMLQKENVSIDDYADCIYHLLLHENITEAIVFGHSMGGYITLSLAERYPRSVKAFGLVNSTAFADSKEKKEMRQKSIDIVNEYGAYSFLKNTIPNLFSDNFKRKNPTAVEALIEAGKSFSPQALIQYYTAMMNRPDRTSTLRNTNAAVLFAVGTEDTAAPLTDLKQQIDLPADKHIHILDQVGHMSMLEATEELNQAMLKFITR